MSWKLDRLRYILSFSTKLFCFTARIGRWGGFSLPGFSLFFLSKIFFSRLQPFPPQHESLAWAGVNDVYELQKSNGLKSVELTRMGIRSDHQWDCKSGARVSFSPCFLSSVAFVFFLRTLGLEWYWPCLPKTRAILYCLSSNFFLFFLGFGVFLWPVWYLKGTGVCPFYCLSSIWGGRITVARCLVFSLTKAICLFNTNILTIIIEILR